MSINDTHEIKVESLVYGGYGLGHLQDGRVVLVPFVAPDEIVEISIVEEKKTHSITKPIKILSPSSDRVRPLCSHFGFCGGCHYQHFSYGDQLRFKKMIFTEQLQRIGKLDTLPEVISDSCNDIWGYRNALQFSVSSLGELCYSDFFKNKEFKVNECLLPMPEIGSLWQSLELDPNLNLERIEFRQNRAGDPMVIFYGREQDIPSVLADTDTSIVHMFGNDQVIIAGEDHLNMKVMDKEFRVSAGSFFQTNFSAAEKLIKVVLDTVGDRHYKSIWDIYCGVGLFSAFLAKATEHLLAIESSPFACNDFAENMDEFDHVDLYQGSAETVLTGLISKPELIIVDPPRAGIKPERMIYISCNPATLARDARQLVGSGYKYKKSTLVDMFPQTYHIESVNVFEF
jgi:23S rRNA (uracil1939-C5)-methyltransferase